MLSQIELLGKCNEDQLLEGMMFVNLSCENLIGCISINTAINTVLHRFVSICKHWQYLLTWIRAHIEPRRKRFSVVSVRMYTCTYTYTWTPAYRRPPCITNHTDNGSWALCGRVECVAWPSTQMSMFHCGESGGRETHRETEGVKWNLGVFVNHRENAVCVRAREKEEREGETGDDRERAGESETGGVCVHALSWLTAGCYSSWHATPSSPHTSGVRLAGGRRGKGEKGGL